MGPSTTTTGASVNQQCNNGVCTNVVTPGKSCTDGVCHAIGMNGQPIGSSSTAAAASNGATVNSCSDGVCTSTTNGVTKTTHYGPVTATSTSSSFAAPATVSKHKKATSGIGAACFPFCNVQIVQLI